MPTFPGIRDTYDQLDKIFKLLGTPTEDSWNGVTHLPGYKPHKLGINDTFIFIVFVSLARDNDIFVKLAMQNAIQSLFLI